MVREVKALRAQLRRVQRGERGAKASLTTMIRESGLHPTRSGLLGIPCFDAYQVTSCFTHRKALVCVHTGQLTQLSCMEAHGMQGRCMAALL